MSGKVVVAVGVLFTVLLLGSAVALELALRAARRVREPASEKPAKASGGSPVDRKREEKRADRDAIGHPGEPDPVDLDKMVKDYMVASREDKPRFVMDPERVRPLMEARARTAGGSKPVSITTQFLGKRADPVEWYLVRASGQSTRGVRSSADFPFRRTSEGFKIDWDSFVGYNPTPLKVFMAERPEAAAVFRGCPPARDDAPRTLFSGYPHDANLLPEHANGV